MSRVYEALQNAIDQRAARASLEGTKPLEPAADEATHDANAARRIPEILAAIRPGSATAGRLLEFEELQQRCARPGWKPKLSWTVFSSEGPGKRQAEQFRTLRARLYSLREARTLQTLLLTSTTMGEGKTFVALNLAQSISRQPGRRTLLIDADLRAPKLHSALGAPSVPGLSDYLAGESDECSIMQANAHERLFFIPAGKQRSDPAELLANNKLRALLSRLGPLFDWIIVDAPPVLPISDAGVLANMCDGVLFVVRAGMVAFNMAQAACGELKNTNLLGVVLNGVEEEAIYGSYGYY